MNTLINTGSGRGPALRRLVAVLAAAGCALAVLAGPASAKHCQTCEDKDAPIRGSAFAGSDVTRGQLALDAVPGAPGGGLTWVRKTL